MRIRVLPDSIRVSTVPILDPETGEPTGETKDVLDFTVNFGLIETRSFRFDMPLNKAAIVAKIKDTVAEILNNRQKADQIKNWLAERGLLEVDTDEL